MVTKKPTSDRRSKASTVSPKKSLRKSSQPRRKTPPKQPQELYHLPKSEIKEFIASKKRHDELDRIREMQEQSRTWWRTIIFCLLLNSIFITLAIYGWVTNGFS